MTYTITDAEMTVELKPFKFAPPECVVTYTLESQLSSITKIDGLKFSIQTDSIVYVGKDEQFKNYVIKLQGIIGDNSEQKTMQAEQSIQIKLANPCYDRTFVDVTIDETQLPEFIVYYIKTKPITWHLPEARIDKLKFGSKDYSFCGNINYLVKANGVITTNNSTDLVTHESPSTPYVTISQQDLTLDEARLSQTSVYTSVVAYLDSQPELRTQLIGTTVRTRFLYCPFEELEVADELPFQNTVYFLSGPSQTLFFDEEKYVTRLTSVQKCGNVRVSFAIKKVDLASSKSGTLSLREVQPDQARYFALGSESFRIDRMSQDDVDILGEYLVTYQLFLEDYPDIRLERDDFSFKLSVQDPCVTLKTGLPAHCLLRVDFVRDARPKWFKDLSDRVIAFGQDYEYPLGTTDDFGNEVGLRLARGSDSRDFIDLNDQMTAIMITGANMDIARVQKRYRVTLYLDFIDIFGKQWTLRKDIHFLVAQLNFPNISFSDTLLFTDDSSIDFEIPFFEYRDKPPTAPKAFIVSKSMEGEVNIAFSEELERIDEYRKMLKDAKVAVLTKEVSETYDYGDQIVIFDRESLEYARFIITTPIMIEYLPVQANQQSTSSKLLDVHFNEITTTHMALKLTFDHPQFIDYEDLVRIRFNSGQFLKSKASGLSIPPGTELYVRIEQQVNDAIQQPLEALFIICLVMTVIVALAIVAMSYFSGIGNIVPIWMFVNSIQLIAYLVLLDIPMPSNASYLLRRFLDTFRLNGKSDQFELSSLADGDASDAGFYESYQDMLLKKETDYDRLHLQVFGYRPSLYENLAPFFYMMLAFLSIWALAILVQLFTGSSDERRSNLKMIMQMCANLFTRFIYLIYVEIAVCSLLSYSLNLSLNDFVYSIVLLSILGLSIFCALVLYCNNVTMLPEKTFRKRKSMWQAPRLRRGLDHLTKVKMQQVQRYIDRVEWRERRKYQQAIEISRKRIVDLELQLRESKKKLEAKPAVKPKPLFKERSAAEHLKSMLPQIPKQNAASQLQMPDDLFEGGAEDANAKEATLRTPITRTQQSVRYGRGFNGETTGASRRNQVEIVVEQEDQDDQESGEEHVTAPHTGRKLLTEDRDEVVKDCYQSQERSSPNTRRRLFQQEIKLIKEEEKKLNLRNDDGTTGILIEQTPEGYFKPDEINCSMDLLSKPGQVQLKQSSSEPSAQPSSESSAQPSSPSGSSSSSSSSDKEDADDDDDDADAESDEVTDEEPAGAHICEKCERQVNFQRRLDKQQKYRLEARRRLILEDMVTIRPHYQTIFNGLKLNHPYNVGILHPLLYLLRRLLYAFMIVFMAKLGIVSAILVQFACLIQICFLCNFRQWKSQVVNVQHLVSEVALYLILTLLISSASIVDPTVRHSMGKWIIFLSSMTVIWNIAVCVYTCYYQLDLINQRKKNMRISAAKLLDINNFQFEDRSHEQDIEQQSKRNSLEDEEEVQDTDMNKQTDAPSQEASQLLERSIERYEKIRLMAKARNAITILSSTGESLMRKAHAIRVQRELNSHGAVSDNMSRLENSRIDPEDPNASQISNMIQKSRISLVNLSVASNDLTPYQFERTNYKFNDNGPIRAAVFYNDSADQIAYLEGQSEEEKESQSEESSSKNDRQARQAADVELSKSAAGQLKNLRQEAPPDQSIKKAVEHSGEQSDWDLEDAGDDEYDDDDDNGEVGRERSRVGDINDLYQEPGFFRQLIIEKVNPNDLPSREDTTASRKKALQKAINLQKKRALFDRVQTQEILPSNRALAGITDSQGSIEKQAQERHSIATSTNMNLKDRRDRFQKKIKSEIYDTMGDILSDEMPSNAQKGHAANITPGTVSNSGYEVNTAYRNAYSKQQTQTSAMLSVENKRRGIKGTAFLKAGVDMVPSHVRQLHRGKQMQTQSGASSIDLQGSFVKNHNTAQNAVHFMTSDQNSSIYSGVNMNQNNSLMLHRGNTERKLFNTNTNTTQLVGNQINKMSGIDAKSRQQRVADGQDNNRKSLGTAEILSGKSNSVRVQDEVESYLHDERVMAGTFELSQIDDQSQTFDRESVFGRDRSSQIFSPTNQNKPDSRLSGCAKQKLTSLIVGANTILSKKID